jgi:hypothetical protein
MVFANAKTILRDHTPAATTSSPIRRSKGALAIRGPSEKRQARVEHAYSTGLGDPEAIDENALQDLAAPHRREAS